MKRNIPNAPPQYDRGVMSQTLSVIQSELGNRQRKDEDYSLVDGQRLILKSPNGTRYSITVSNAGVLSATAI